jgi:hypothetical protein
VERLAFAIGSLRHHLMYSNHAFKQVRIQHSIVVCQLITRQFNVFIDLSTYRQIFRCCRCFTRIDTCRRCRLSLQRYRTRYVACLSRQCSLLSWLRIDNEISQLSTTRFVKIKSMISRTSCVCHDSIGKQSRSIVMFERDVYFFVLC